MQFLNSTASLRGLILLLCSFALSLHNRTVAEEHCVVASVHPLATDAGLSAFQAGGNAVDAAIATALTLGVVDNHNSGLGGGCFILIRKADGSLLAIDGREMAPAAATRDMYVRDGKADPELSTTGPLAVGVPGALAAYARALKLCGELSLAELISPAASIAEEGFAVNQSFTDRTRKMSRTLARFPGTKSVLLKPDGSVYEAGELLKQPDLAHSYRMIANQGPEWFYHGEFAEKVGAWMAENDGIITRQDFANYRTVDREPLQTTYHDRLVIGFPPPSSGGVHVAEILNILEDFDLRKELENDTVKCVHIVAEAMKLAFADRAYWLGDSDFAKVPRGLVDKDYAKKLAQRIDRDRVIEVPHQGTPPNAETNLFGKHTTHIAAADSLGNWVAITATINTTFGSKVIVPGTGIVLNDEMDDFSSQPGVPNAFGLIGAENNSIAPGKRPLSSMSPTILLESDGKPILTVGAAGGPKIITQVLQVLIRKIDYGQDLAGAVAAPRIHHQWQPDQILAEEGVPESVLAGLRNMGHKIEMIDSSGVTQAIAVEKGELVGVHDPRVPGKAASATRD